MDDEIERLLVSVRADTSGFTRDVAEMRRGLEGPLGLGAARVGQIVEGSLLRAVRTGKLGFEELRHTALGVMGDIAAASLRSGLDAAVGGRGGLIGGLLTGLLGLPGRATGGPVAPTRPYLVGERGPELFVPTASGRVVPMTGGSGGRDVRITVNVAAGRDAEAARMLQRSGRQVARAVRAAMAAGE